MSTRASVAMIVRNEAAGIGRAIRSAQRLRCVDEVVVLDTGSTDRTLEIARDLGATVFEEPWTDDFAFHRNQCMDRCRNDWILSLDGDEELVDPGDIDGAIGKGSFDGLAVTIRCMVGLKVEEECMAVRLFDRGMARWRYAIHEQPVGLTSLYPTRAVVVARYDRSFQEATRQRVARTLALEQQHRGDPHYPFFLAKMYRALHDFGATQQWARRYLRLGEDHAREAEVWVWLVEAALHRGGPDRAREVCDEALARHPRYPDLRHLHMALAVHQWYDASERLDPRYLGLARRSQKYTANLRQVIPLLGLPMRFEGGRGA